jgi:hypothetical protein
MPQAYGVIMYKGLEHQPKGASVVYWIHKPEHTDITKEGYVGITNGMARDRWLNHKSASRRKVNGNCEVINRAIRKHNDLIYEVVLVADTRDYCERIEAMLRPTNRIGWNIARGGIPVDTMMGGTANKERWIQYWIDNPIEAANRWWNAERVMLNKQARVQRKASLPKPHTKARKVNARNKSGYTGVTWFSKYSKWRSQIGIHPEVVTLGYFDTKEQAYATYLKAKHIRLQYRNGILDFNDAIASIRTFQSVLNT